MNVLITALFGFFVTLAINENKRIQVHLKERSTPYLGVHLTNDSAALQLKASGCRNFEFHWERALCVLVFDSGVTGDL